MVSNTHVGVKKGAWSADEDEKLCQYIQEHGERRWRSVPSGAGLNRRGRSCRLRWLNYLRPNIKRGNISDQEEDLIIRLHKLLGNRWSLIAGRLPGRTDNEIKNYWNTHLSKKLTFEQNKARETAINNRKPRDEPNNVTNSEKLNSDVVESNPRDSDRGMREREFDVDGFFTTAHVHSIGSALNSGKQMEAVEPQTICGEEEEHLRNGNQQCDFRWDESPLWLPWWTENLDQCVDYC